METSYGSKYEETKDLDIVEVAKLIKKELREEWPEFKWSVRTEKYSGGQSVKVKIKEAPESFKLFNSTWLSEFKNNEYSRAQKYTEEASELLEEARNIVEAYNFDGSDARVDYFHVRFYKSVDYDRDLERERREVEASKSFEAEKLKEEIESNLQKIEELREETVEMVEKLKSLEK